MAKITATPVQYNLTLSEPERLAILAALRYRSSHADDETRHGAVSRDLIATLTEADDNG